MDDSVSFGFDTQAHTREHGTQLEWIKRTFIPLSLFASIKPFRLKSSCRMVECDAHNLLVVGLVVSVL